VYLNNDRNFLPPVAYKSCSFKGKVSTEFGFLRFQGPDEFDAGNDTADGTTAVRLESVTFEPVDGVALSVSGRKEVLEAAKTNVFTDTAVVAKFGNVELQITPNLEDAESVPVPFLTLEHPFYQRYLLETVRGLRLPLAHSC
jgi:hypothetical protein